MRSSRTFRTLLVTAALGALMAGCPPTAQATRDGGQPCTTTPECNAVGQSCGLIHLCVQGFCAESTVIRACDDGGYPDGPAIGECQAVEDCNEGQICGVLINCLNSQCDRDGGRVVLSCADAGSADANRSDGAMDARPASDASTDVNTDATADRVFPTQDGFTFPD